MGTTLSDLERIELDALRKENASYKTALQNYRNGRATEADGFGPVVTALELDVVQKLREDAKLIQELERGIENVRADRQSALDDVVRLKIELGKAQALSPSTWTRAKALWTRIVHGHPLQ